MRRYTGRKLTACREIQGFIKPPAFFIALKKWNNFHGNKKCNLLLGDEADKMFASRLLPGACWASRRWWERLHHGPIRGAFRWLDANERVSIMAQLREPLGYDLLNARHGQAFIQVWHYTPKKLLNRSLHVRRCPIRNRTWNRDNIDTSLVMGHRHKHIFL